MARNYYHILGLGQNASLNDIKRAYRLKAKRLHPDVNASLNAHEEFVQLHEAYEYLLHIKTGKTIGKSTRNRKYSQQEWERNEREKARERARARAKKRYQELLNSEEYKLSMAILNLVKIVLVVVIGTSPIWLSLLYGPRMIFASLVVITLVVVSFSEVLKADFYKDLKTSFELFIQSPIKYMLLFIFVNGCCLFAFAFKTVVSHAFLIVLYLALLGIGIWLVSSFFSDTKAPKYLYKSFAIATITLNLFFILNYSFSGESQFESYSYTLFKQNKNTHSRRDKDMGYIFLENEAYKNQLWTRAVFNPNEFRMKNTVTLEVAKGLFGIKVIRSIELSKK